MNIKNVISWVGIAVLTCIAAYLSVFIQLSSPIKILVWIVWFLLSGIIVYFTPQGQALLVFAREAKIELQKVVWPTRQETIQTTSIVMVMVGLTGFILWGIDAGMMWAISKITQIG